MKVLVSFSLSTNNFLEMLANKIISRQAGTLFPLALCILVFGCNVVSAQYERVVSGFKTENAKPMCETYDKGIIIVAADEYKFGTPSYIAKLSLEGQELWRIKLYNIYSLNSIVETRDSGLAVCGTVHLYPESSEDSAMKSCLLKFDKCGTLQWAKYISVTNYNYSYNLIENTKGELFLCTDGINGWHDLWCKRISVLKFSKQGKLLAYESFEGMLAKLYKGKDDDEMYLSQFVFVTPTQKDTLVALGFTGITKINSQLETQAKTVLGFKDLHTSFYGPIVVKGDNVLSLSYSKPKGSTGRRGLMFLDIDKFLSLRREPWYDIITESDMYAAGAATFGDSTIVPAGIGPERYIDSVYTSVRLYDKDFRLLKETSINKSWYSITQSIVPLKNGNQFILGIFNRDSKYYGSMYLYDRHLNPQAWPTVPPARGYDWACNTSIPKSQVIEVDKVVKPVRVRIDNSRPDWVWLYNLHQPDSQNIGPSRQGWYIWPQPVATGGSLHLRPQADLNLPILTPIQARFYDTQGRLVASVPAIPAATGQWDIKELNLLGSGLYLADLMDNNTGLSLGRIKVVVY